MANFGDIRETLQQPPSQETWTEIAEGLQNWYGTEPLPSVLEYCSSHISHWPDDLATFAPRAWFKRSSELYAKSPITAFFAYCFGERTTHFIEEAHAMLAACKPLKPPKFVDLAALGELRWRSGEAFDEEHKKRFIKLLRENDTELGNLKLERLRQLLNDEDAQRWSRQLHAQWVSDGEKSAHKWALFQIAYLGVESDISFTTSSLNSMVSSGRHARVSQYLAINASFESHTSMACITDFALIASLHSSTRYGAVEQLKHAAQALSLTPRAYVARHTAYFEPFYNTLIKASNAELGDVLQEAMVRQIDVPAWILQQHVLTDPQHHQSFACVVLAVGEERFRVVEGQPATLEGKPFALLAKHFVHVVHPAELTELERHAWSSLFIGEHLTPPFSQLSHELFATPLIPREGIPVRDLWFHESSRFSTGPPEGHGYTSTLEYIPANRDWYITLSLSYAVSTWDLETLPGEGSPHLKSMSIHSKFGVPLSHDPVINSEARRMTQHAIDLAQQEPSD